MGVGVGVGVLVLVRVLVRGRVGVTVRVGVGVKGSRVEVRQQRLEHLDLDERFPQRSHEQHKRARRVNEARAEHAHEHAEEGEGVNLACIRVGEIEL